MITAYFPEFIESYLLTSKMFQRYQESNELKWLKLETTIEFLKQIES